MARNRREDDRARSPDPEVGRGKPARRQGTRGKWLLPAVGGAFMREFHVVLVEDCAAAPTDEEHQATVFNVRRYFGQVAGSPEVVALWSGETDG